MLLAVYLPWVEIFAALGLFVRRVQLGAASIIAAMTALFMGALASAWARGLRIECGCFGRDEAASDIPTLILRDAFILAAALILFFLDSRKTPAQERSMFAETGRFTLP
jgi:hypothetical protein